MGRHKSAYLQCSSKVCHPNDLIEIGYISEIVSDIDYWMETNIQNVPSSVLRAMKTNILNSSKNLADDYLMERQVFKALYGAPENKIAIKNISQSVKKI